MSESSLRSNVAKWSSMGVEGWEKKGMSERCTTTVAMIEERINDHVFRADYATRGTW